MRRCVAWWNAVGGMVLIAAMLLPAWGGPQRPYEGVTLTVITQSPPYIAKPVQMFGPDWERRTGGKINLVTVPFGELYQRIMSAFTLGAGGFDVLVFASAWMGDFAGNRYLLDLTERIRQDRGLQWEDILPTYRQTVNWGGRLYGLPVDGDVHLVYYRRDVLENPQHRAAFRQRFGRELQPPRTWVEYREIAEFFSGRDWAGDGRRRYGVLEAFRRGGQAFWFFMSHAAAYVCPPGLKGCLFFDPDTMRPHINNPGFVRALEEWTRLVRLGPPGMINFDSGDVRSQFAAGVAVLAKDWGDTGIVGSTDPKSVVKGKVGTIVLPGSLEVYNYRTRSWSRLPRPNVAPYLAFGGWVCGVAATTRYPDAAYDLCRTLAGPRNSYIAVTTSETGFNPFRASHFRNLEGWRRFGFVEPDLSSYLRAIEQSLSHPNAQLDLKLPGQARYLDALETQLARAAAGQATPQQALDAAAAEWERITNELGRDRQRRLYRAWLGLPD
jgi:multiple sugar transport system substrate-binding protein